MPYFPPLPPDDLIYRVTGKRDPDLFDLSGQVAIDDFRDGLASIGRRFREFRSIYDFGCGCGRVLRWLPLHVPRARLVGSDIDEAAIAWLRTVMPDADLRVTQPLPPLPFGKGAFDLVIGYSVFTHLDEKYQDAWLAELHRITRPGSILLLTVSGNVMWEWTMRRSGHPHIAELQAMRSTLDNRGFVHWRGDGWEQFFPDFYHTSFHLPKYIRTHWSRWFAIAAVLEGKARPAQDLVILRRTRWRRG
jgi:SAM-dependent methyltransferase